MKHILFVLIGLVATTASAQDFYWAKQLGGTQSDYGKSVVTDHQGNVFVAIEFQGSTILGDSSFQSNGGNEAAIAKFSSDGDFIKAYHFGGQNYDVIKKIDVDGMGNIYFIGQSSGEFEFDGVTYPLTFNSDIFVAKLTNDLDEVWLKTGGSNSEDRGYDLAVDQAGNVYFTGYTFGDITFDGTYIPGYGNSDIFLGKINASGSTSWISRHGGIDYDAGFAIDLVDDEHFVAGGEFIGAGTVGGQNITQNIVGNDQTWIALFDTSGTALWATTADNAGFNSAQALAHDSEGNIYAAGHYQGSTYFGGDTVLVSDGGFDAYLVKYSPTGDFVWARSAHSTGSVYTYGLECSADDILYLTGQFQNTLTITPTDQIVSNGFYDVMMISVLTDGDLNWYAGLGAGGSDSGNDLHVDDEGRIYGVGSFEYEMLINGETFDAQNSPDAFLVKISPCVFPNMSFNTSVAQQLCADEPLGVTLFNTEEGVLYTMYANGDEADADTQGLIELYLEADASLFELGTNEITFTGMGEGCADIVTLDTTFLVELHENPTSDFTHAVVGGQSVFTDGSICADQITDWEWDIEGTMENTQNVTIELASGDYNVCLNAISEFGCENLFCQTISVLTGIEEYGNESLNIRYDAYNELMRWNYNAPLTIEFYDMSGRLVATQSATNQVNVTALAPQMYAFRMLEDNEVVATGKLLK